MHSPMQLMHPNSCHVAIMYMYMCMYMYMYISCMYMYILYMYMYMLSPSSICKPVTTIVYTKQAQKAHRRLKYVTMYFARASASLIHKHSWLIHTSARDVRQYTLLGCVLMSISCFLEWLAYKWWLRARGWSIIQLSVSHSMFRWEIERLLLVDCRYLA